MKSLRRALFLWVCPLLVVSGWAGEPRPSAKHSKAGLTCLRCHGEEKPGHPPASDQSCIDCHGDLPAVAADTKGAAVNPHRVPAGAHPAPGACISCHREHRQPVVTCLECHPTFRFTAK